MSSNPGPPVDPEKTATLQRLVGEMRHHEAERRRLREEVSEEAGRLWFDSDRWDGRNLQAAMTTTHAEIAEVLGVSRTRAHQVVKNSSAYVAYMAALQAQSEAYEAASQDEHDEQLIEQARSDPEALVGISARRLRRIWPRLDRARLKEWLGPDDYARVVRGNGLADQGP